MNKLFLNSKDKMLQSKVIDFVQLYGETALSEAIDIYTDTHQKYICKTKTSISKISIYDIYYIEINKHHLQIHTAQDTYYKYGSLSQELKQLSKYGFIKCSQNCIVSLDKIKQIRHNEITLIDNSKLHISRSMIASVLLSYSQWRK